MSIKGFCNVPVINGLLFWGCGALGAGCTVVGVWQGLVDVGLVLGLPCGGFAVFFSETGGLRLTGAITSLEVFPNEVHWRPWLMVEVWESLGILLVPWPYRWGFLMGSSMWGFVSSGLFVIVLCWCIV